MLKKQEELRTLLSYLSHGVLRLSQVIFVNNPNIVPKILYTKVVKKSVPKLLKNQEERRTLLTYLSHSAHTSTGNFH